MVFTSDNQVLLRVEGICIPSSRIRQAKTKHLWASLVHPPVRIGILNALFALRSPRAAGAACGARRSLAPRGGRVARRESRGGHSAYRVLPYGPSLSTR